MKFSEYCLWSDADLTSNTSLETCVNTGKLTPVSLKIMLVWGSQIRQFHWSRHLGRLEDDRGMIKSFSGWFLSGHLTFLVCLVVA